MEIVADLYSSLEGKTGPGTHPASCTMGTRSLPG